MNSLLKKLIYILILVAIGLFIYSYINAGLFNSKLSPEDTISFNNDSLKITIYYSRPSKRERDVFGALVPYDKVWRTGANEATTFKTNKPLLIGKDSLLSGKYTLWTIPNKSLWTVIFNSKMYPWGVNNQMEAMRKPEFDALIYKSKPIELDKPVEQFTIDLENSNSSLMLTLVWDKTKVIVPLN